MTIQDQVYVELQKTDFPNLKFLFSNEVLDEAETILNSLLENEKQDFEKKLRVRDEDISFETFQEFSYLDYFFSLLEHFQ